MRNYKKIFGIMFVFFLSIPVFAQQVGTTVALWRDRGDVAALNLLDGQGGKEHQPGTTLDSSRNPRAELLPSLLSKMKTASSWKVKLGHEVKSETAATRLVWAAGYFTDEDYYRPQIRVEGMKRLSRGQKYVSDGGLVREARLERQDGREEIEELELVRKPLSRHAGVQRP